MTDKPLWAQAAMLTPPDINRIDKRFRDRLGTLLAVDDMVKAIIDTLTVTGKLGNTYIFFTSDNGFEQGEHRIKQGKQTPYEEAIHVPLLVRGPGVPVEVRTELVSNIDYAPTFLEIAGGSADITLDGHSLMPFLESSPAHPLWRTALLVEHWIGADTLIDKAIPNYQLLRMRNQVYIEYVTGEKELYDLRTDPYQLQNAVSTVTPAKLASYAALLGGLKGCVGEDCFPSEHSLQTFEGEVAQSYPNPFNPVAVVSFLLAQKSRVRIAVYDILGREVAELSDGWLDAGKNTVLLNGENLASGTYFCHIESAQSRQVLKLALVK